MKDVTLEGTALWVLFLSLSPSSRLLSYFRNWSPFCTKTPVSSRRVDMAQAPPALPCRVEDLVYDWGDLQGLCQDPQSLTVSLTLQPVLGVRDEQGQHTQSPPAGT